MRKKSLKDETFLTRIAARVKALRRARGKTQMEVYLETKIHVGKIETAKYNISVTTLAALCDYFGISLNEFFSGRKIR